LDFRDQVLVFQGLVWLYYVLVAVGALLAWSPYREGLQQKKTPHRFEKAVTKIAEINAVRFSTWDFLFFLAISIKN
jgi:hypothetical protein